MHQQRTSGVIAERLARARYIGKNEWRRAAAGECAKTFVRLGNGGRDRRGRGVRLLRVSVVRQDGGQHKSRARNSAKSAMRGVTKKLCPPR